MTDRVVWILAGGGLTLSALGWLLDPSGFYGAWLAGLILIGAWSLGSLALLLIHALTGGRWGQVLRPALLLGICALPLLVVALPPLLAGLPVLYEWARPDIHLDNSFYLNLPFFAARAAIYFLVWFGLAAFVLFGAAARIAAPGLFVLAITFTFAAIDAMSLDSRFFSSISGMIAACGAALLAFSVAVLVTGASVPARERADLGKLLLALVILWIYLDFMQLLIIWQSDLTDEASWYLARSRGLWGLVWIVMVLGHFLLPFALLLSPRLQRSREAIIGIAMLLIAMEVLRAWWTVLPTLGQGIGWIDVASVAGLSGAAFGSARWLARRPKLAKRLRHV
jgi:hypothetical protein